MGVGAIIGDALSGGGGALLDGAAKLVDAIKGKNPEDAAALQALLEKHQDLVVQTDADITKAQIQSNVDLNAIAGQNVRADAQSGDKFTSRARPGVIWVGLFIMTWSYVMIPMLSIHWQFLKPVTFPDMFWETWAAISMGVVVTRSADKLFGGSGGSIQLPFGIKADSKGD